MKKNDLLKAIGIIFIGFVILSWIIPTGSFSGGEFTSSATHPIGLVSLVKYPIISLSSSVFVLTALVILFIGGFYGVLNKTGVYSKVVDGFVKNFKGKEKTFLVISILIFSILTSLTALTLPMFILVPFFVSVILLLGYNKITALLSTVGAILVGNMGSTYGFNINGYVTYFLGTDIHSSILYRAILLVLLVGTLIFFVLKTSKIEKKKATKKSTKKNEEVSADELVIPLYEKTTAKKLSTKPMIIISVVAIILSLVGMFDWYDTLKVNFFNDIYTKVMEFELNGYTIFANIIGTLDPIGYWSNYDLACILLLASLLIGWVYNLKLKDTAESFINGMKEMIPVSVYTILASVIFLIMNSSTETIYTTIANFFLSMTDGLNVVTLGLTSAVGGLLYSDFPYMLNAIYDPIKTLYKDYDLIALILQSIHGIVMLIAPVSVILVAGLKYLNISYKEWLKNVWKYLLLAFISIVIVIALMALL